MSQYGMVQHDISEDIHYLTVRHRVNKKFSDFLAYGSKAMAEDLAFNITIQNVDRDILFITFREISNT